VAHEIVLEKLGLAGIERELDIAADAGIDTVDALTTLELRIERGAAFVNALAGAAVQLDMSTEPRRLFHVFDGERAQADD